MQEIQALQTQKLETFCNLLLHYVYPVLHPNEAITSMTFGKKNEKPCFINTSWLYNENKIANLWCVLSFPKDLHCLMFE